MRVAVLATGVMELLGLPACLGRLFPAHTFEVTAAREALPGAPAEPFPQSLTSRICPAPPEDDVPTNLQSLVGGLAECIYPPRRDAPDFAVVVDDLELCNVDQPGVAVAAVRRAVERHVDQARLRPHEKDGLRRCLRERASFHLAVPMTEAWFYGDPQSPARNGVPAHRPVLVKPGVDPEAFEADDPAYSVDDGSACAALHRRNDRPHKKLLRVPWLVPAQPRMPWVTRERHPKAYMQWLCRDAAERSCTAWQESNAGAEALQALDWAAILANPAHCAYARALIEDLADALGESPPIPKGGTIAPLTRRKLREREAVLRNL